MRNSGFELRRITLPRNPVNKAKNEGRAAPDAAALVLGLEAGCVR